MPGRIVCQWDKDGVEDAGLVKVDILGLRMLSLIQEAVELIKEGRGIDIDLEKIPLDDGKVYDMICRADTMGVFQVESRAQMQTLPGQGRGQSKTSPLRSPSSALDHYRGTWCTPTSVVAGQGKGLVSTSETEAHSARDTGCHPLPGAGAEVRHCRCRLYSG
jgi:hypothetical protein